MHNMIIFGKDIFRTDIVGHWLGGHEPGNFGFFHIAVERGMSDALDPRKVPVYLWDGEAAVRRPVESFHRTPLLTYYLQRDYGGWTEPLYHMVDEPYDYGSAAIRGAMPQPEKPSALVLFRDDSSASVEYTLPMSGFTRLEITDGSGATIAVPVDDYRLFGSHMVSWDIRGRQSGRYGYRLRTNSHVATGALVL